MCIIGSILEIAFSRKSSTKNHTTKPVLQVPNEFSKELLTKLPKRYHLPGPIGIESSQKLQNVPHQNIHSDPNLRAATSSFSAASILIYENPTLIALTDIATEQEHPYASIEENLETQTFTA